MQARRGGNFSLYRAKVENNTVVGLGVAGWMLAALAANMAPVKTGVLASSLTYTPAASAGDGSYYCIVGPSVGYGRWQELGTKYMEAQPYLLPALNILRSEVKRTIASYAVGAGKFMTK